MTVASSLGQGAKEYAKPIFLIIQNQINSTQAMVKVISLIFLFNEKINSQKLIRIKMKVQPRVQNKFLFKGY